VDIVNNRGYSLLHDICFKNLEEMAVAIMERANQVFTDNQVRQWVNFKTEEDGFVALHFASFRGNVNIINLLLSNGADMYARNNFGINMLHVAA
jgi:palmitoyltransferase ZDHHC13/17